MSRKKLSRRDFMKLTGMAGAGMALGSNLLPIFAKDDISGSISYIHHFTSETEFIGMENVIIDFTTKYPDVELSQENIPNADFMSKFTALVIGDARPDTTMVTAGRLGDMVAMDGLVDLTEQINNWELKEFFPESVWVGITLDEKIYGVPAFSFIDWMYYRTDWLEEAELDAPTNFDEFLEVALAFTDAENGRYGFGLRGGDGGQNMVLDVCRAFGTDFVVDGDIVVDRDKFTDAIRWYSELSTVHGVVPPSVTADSYRQIMEGFKTGQTGMVWHHTGSLTEISEALEPNVQFGTVARPMGPEDYPTQVAFLYNGIMSDRNMDASWAWISHWGQTDPGIAFLEATGYFPANSQVAEDPRLAENDLYGAAFDALAVGHLPPSFVGNAGWASNVVLPEFQKILIGDATVEEAVDAMLIGLEETME